MDWNGRECSCTCQSFMRAAACHPVLQRPFPPHTHTLKHARPHARTLAAHARTRLCAMYPRHPQPPLQKRPCSRQCSRPRHISRWLWCRTRWRRRSTTRGTVRCRRGSARMAPPGRPAGGSCSRRCPGGRVGAGGKAGRRWGDQMGCCTLPRTHARSVSCGFRGPCACAMMYESPAAGIRHPPSARARAPPPAPRLPPRVRPHRLERPGPPSPSAAATPPPLRAAAAAAMPCSSPLRKGWVGRGRLPLRRPPPRCYMLLEEEGSRQAWPTPRALQGPPRCVLCGGCGGRAWAVWAGAGRAWGRSQQEEHRARRGYQPGAALHVILTRTALTTSCICM